MYNQFDTHAFVKMFVNAKTDEERGEILANTISQTRQENVIIVEKPFRKSISDLASKHDVSDVKKENSDIKSEIYDTRRDINDIKKEIKTIHLKISEVELKISEVELKIAQLEIRMTNKFYIAFGCFAVFLTTVILGVLPFVLKAS